MKTHKSANCDEHWSVVGCMINTDFKFLAITIVWIIILSLEKLKA